MLEPVIRDWRLKIAKNRFYVGGRRAFASRGRQRHDLCRCPVSLRPVVLPGDTCRAHARVHVPRLPSSDRERRTYSPGYCWVGAVLRCVAGVCMDDGLPTVQDAMTMARSLHPLHTQPARLRARTGSRPWYVHCRRFTTDGSPANAGLSPAHSTPCLSKKRRSPMARGRRRSSRTNRYSGGQLSRDAAHSLATCRTYTEHVPVPFW